MGHLHAQSSILAIIKAHGMISFFPGYQIRHATFSKQIVVEKMADGRVVLKKKYLPMSTEGVEQALALIDAWRNNRTEAARRGESEAG